MEFYKRARSPSARSQNDAIEYATLSLAGLKAKYNIVYEEFARCVRKTNPGARLPDHYDNIGWMKSLSSSEATVKSHLIHEIINMEASTRELTDAAAAAAAAAAADAAADAADAAAPLSHGQLVARHKQRVYQLERAHNAVDGFGPLTNEQRDAHKNRGGRTKRAKKAKRSHRHRHLKQRCRTRKH
jgi:hypothetical protein